MARVHTVKSAQQRYRTVPVLDDDGQPKKSPVTRKDGSPKTTKNGRAIERRVTVSDKSQPLPNNTCGKCGSEITVGSSYRWVKTKSGPYGGRTMYRCMTCPTWRQSELSSSKMAGIYAAQENLDDSIGGVESVDELSDLASSFAESVREVAEEYRESQSNMVDGFGHDTQISDELGEKADGLDSWADEIESLDFEEYDEEEPTLEDLDDLPDETEDEKGDRLQEAVEVWENDREAHWEEQAQLLTDLANDIPY